VRAALVAACLPIVLVESAWAARPQLLGRWGETRLPEQLVDDDATPAARALVVVTCSTTCPLARRLAPLLSDLQRRFAREGVQFIGLFPNASDDLSEIARYAVELDLAFPVFKDDPQSPWHAELAMTVTPEVVVLDVRDGVDAKKTIYRGQVNGRWAGGAHNGQREYLADALHSFVNGNAADVFETAPSGCRIAPRMLYDRSDLQEVVFYRDIVPLLQQHCQSCHREGEAGAALFAPLNDYQTVASLSATLLDRIENRIMPPWHAEAHPDAGVGGLKHDPRLNQRQIDLFRAWVDDGCPAGDPRDAPPPREWPDPRDWAIGTPDLVFQMPEPYRVPAYRLDEYQYYRIPANFAEDRYIQAIELRPGNKAVVHHIGAIVGPASDEKLTSNQAMLRLYGLAGDRVKKIGDYIAGDPFNARVYPDGYALKLPAGHDIFFEMHYAPTGASEESDLSQLAIRWADGPPQHVLKTKVFNRKDIRLPPGDAHYEQRCYHMFETDVLIHALGPHMHYRGKDFSLYKVVAPQTEREQRQLVLRVPTYHFSWQRTYEFEKPLRLKAGEALLSVTHFDNSRFNPHNPDPAAVVRYGLKSEQEMLNVRFKYESVDFGDAP